MSATKIQPCSRCGRDYGPTADERRRHRTLQGHTPSPERAPAPDADDLLLRERDAMEREAGKGRAS